MRRRDRRRAGGGGGGGGVLDLCLGRYVRSLWRCVDAPRVPSWSKPLPVEARYVVCFGCLCVLALAVLRKSVSPSPLPLPLRRVGPTQR